MFILLAAIVCSPPPSISSARSSRCPRRERHRALRRAADYGRVRDAGARAQRPLPPACARARHAARSQGRAAAPPADDDGVDLSARCSPPGLGRTISPTAFLAAKGAGGCGGAFLGLASAAPLPASGGGALLRGRTRRDRLRRSPASSSRCKARIAQGRSGPSCRTRSTCSAVASRPASASTAQWRS